MTTKNILIRNGHHHNPMIRWLSRHGIGSADKHERGIWVSPSALPEIERIMRSVRGNENCDIWSLWVSVDTHNTLTWSDIMDVLDHDAWEAHRAEEERIRREAAEERSRINWERWERQRQERLAREAEEARERAEHEEADRIRREAEERERQEQEEHSSHLTALLQQYLDRM